MPRSGSGVYTLPPSNPVVPFTTIATTWANPTLQDIATALTNSLDRTGLGGMLSQFLVADGTVVAPGVAFTNEPSLGLARLNPGVMSFVVGAAETFKYASNRVTFVPNTVVVTGLAQILKNNVSRSWIWNNATTGVLQFMPSATVALEDWDGTKGIKFTASSGFVEFLNDVGIDGNAGVLGTFSVGGTLSVTGVASFTSISDTGGLSCGSATVVNALTVGSNINVTAATGTGKVSSKGYTEVGYDNGNITGAKNLDYNNAQVQVGTITGNTTFTLTNCPDYTTLKIILAATNAGTIAWTGVSWPLGATPNLAAGPSKFAVVELLKFGGAIFGRSDAY